MNTKEEVLAFEPPAARLLSREVVAVNTEAGGATVRYTARPDFLNRHGTVQGGFLAAMLDSATALGLYGVLPPEQTAVTVNLNVTYVRPAKVGTFTAQSRLLNRDARFAEVSAELLDAEGVVVASAIAKLRIIRRVHMRQPDAPEGMS
jgi:uncharacterized protein (TIGR00369 family)